MKFGLWVLIYANCSVQVDVLMTSTSIICQSSCKEGSEPRRQNWVQNVMNTDNKVIKCYIFSCVCNDRAISFILPTSQ